MNVRPYNTLMPQNLLAFGPTPICTCLWGSCIVLWFLSLFGWCLGRAREVNVKLVNVHHLVLYLWRAKIFMCKIIELTCIFSSFENNFDLSNFGCQLGSSALIAIPSFLGRAWKCVEVNDLKEWNWNHATFQLLTRFCSNYIKDRMTLDWYHRLNSGFVAGNKVDSKRFVCKFFLRIKWQFE